MFFGLFFVCYQSCLHFIPGIKCHYIYSEEVLKRTTLPSIGSVLFQTEHEVYWIRHLAKTLCACLKKSFSESFMKESTPVGLPESIKQLTRRLDRCKSTISHGRQLVFLSERGHSEVQDTERPKARGLRPSQLALIIREASLKFKTERPKAGGLRPSQLVFLSERGLSKVEDREA